LAEDVVLGALVVGLLPDELHVLLVIRVILREAFDCRLLGCRPRRGLRVHAWPTAPEERGVWVLVVLACAAPQLGQDADRSFGRLWAATAVAHDEVEPAVDADRLLSRDAQRALLV
jgi:hypothetical protein